MLLKKIHACYGTQMNHVSQIIAPQSKPPYYSSYDYGQILQKKEQKQVEQLFAETLSVLIDPRDNLESFKKTLKKMVPSELNIVSDNGIEWGLKEKLLMIVNEMNSNNLVFQVSSNNNQEQILQKGYLEIYGVSPYRHLNKYIHEYDCTMSEMQIRYKEIQERQVTPLHRTETEEVQDALKNTVKEGQQQKDGILVKTKNAFFKFNSIFKKDEKKEESKAPNLKEMLRNSLKSKDSHILVRDYEIESETQIYLKRKDNGLILQGEEWVEENCMKAQRSTFYLRTETLIDPKESISLKLNKSIVLTDFNWVMRGNPWIWVYRFDLQQ